MSKADVPRDFAKDYAEACRIAIKALEERAKRNEGSTMTLPERIASEIMDTIERERRINKDDLVAAAERVVQRWMRADELAKAWDEVAERLSRPPGVMSMNECCDEKTIVEVMPSYFRPKAAPTRFGTQR